MHDNVLPKKDLQCFKRLWHFTFPETIGYFAVFLGVTSDLPVRLYVFCFEIYFPPVFLPLKID